MAHFDLAALGAALDAKRQEMGLSWQELARQATDRPSRRSERRIAPSTFSGLGGRNGARDTVVLQALRWLDRTPESFVRGAPSAAGRAIPDDDSGRPALDTVAVHRALDEKRAERHLTWREVAAEVGPGFNPAMLTGLAHGTAMGFPRVMRIFLWLGRPVADFTVFIPDESD